MGSGRKASKPGSDFMSASRLWAAAARLASRAATICQQADYGQRPQGQQAGQRLYVSKPIMGSDRKVSKPGSDFKSASRLLAATVRSASRVATTLPASRSEAVRTMIRNLKGSSREQKEARELTPPVPRFKGHETYIKEELDV